MQFFDTNVLIYSVSTRPDGAAKRQRAERLLSTPGLGTSVQVLQEFYVQATRPQGSVGMSHAHAAALVRSIDRFPIQPMTLDVLHAALTIRARHGFSYWDSAIIAAALALGCDTLLTEDLSHGQRIDGLTITNPFL